MDGILMRLKLKIYKNAENGCRAILSTSKFIKMGVGRRGEGINKVSLSQ